MDRIQAVSQELALRPEVRYVAFVAGSHDLIVEAFFYSRRHLAVFLTEQLATMDGVLASESQIVLQVSKLSYEWEIPDLAPWASPPHAV
jgi:DNA-binding Lrp family transcriptional regulator